MYSFFICLQTNERNTQMRVSSTSFYYIADEFLCKVLNHSSTFFRTAAVRAGE